MVKNVYMIVTEKLLLSCIHFVNIIIMWIYVYQGKKTQGIVTCHLMAQLSQVPVLAILFYKFLTSNNKTLAEYHLCYIGTLVITV
jgi:hypothetical protein